MRDTPTGRCRGTTRGVDPAARQPRRSLTPAEQTLWQALRRNRLNGLSFRRQHPVGPFVLDCSCPASKLVVELDGSVLDEQTEQDAYRTGHLAAYGYRVLRCRNEDVLNDRPAVLSSIAAAAQASPRALTGRQSPPPLGP